ncbi:MAG TPA: hypothetical protein PLK77_06235 [Pyrinomonadaceae bacterium]|nr:hypothetical protein [Pyrinomonadaceae bacterium]
MTSGPISLSRRHVLGDLYSRCDVIASIPVYLNSVDGEMLGHVDQGLGHYADAFSFHLADDICKKLSAGFFTYAFDYEYSEVLPGSPKRVKLNSICLIARQNYERPVARSVRGIG